MGCVAVFFIAISSSAAEISSAEKLKKQKAVASAILVSSTLRSLGLQGKFLSSLSPVLAGKWQNDFKQLYVDGKSPLIMDFFRGAVTLIGPQNGKTGIIGFYDPWSDNILLLAVNYETKLQIADYRFLSGAFFRTGKADRIRIAQTVFPTEAPLQVALLQAVSATGKKFMATFPVQMKQIGLQSVPAAADITVDEIKANMAARFKRAMTLLQANNNELLAKLLICNTLIKKTPFEGFKNLFGHSKAAMKMAKAIADMPSEFRKGFKICYYLPMKNSSQFAYLNPANPSVVIIINVPADPKRQYSLAFMDLGMADRLLAVLKKNSEKGGRK